MAFCCYRCSRDLQLATEDDLDRVPYGCIARDRSRLDATAYLQLQQAGRPEPETRPLAANQRRIAQGC